MMITTSKLGFLLFLAAVASNVHGICWNCMPPDLPDDDIDRILAEDFKKRLIEKLGMKDDVELSGNLTSPPQEIIEELVPVQDDGLEEKENETMQTILLQPLNEESTVSNTTSFFEFQVGTNELNGYRVESATLWLHTTSDTDLFQVYEKLSHSPRRIILMNENHGATGWKKMMFKPSRRWLANPWRKMRIEVEGLKTPVMMKPLMQLNIKRVDKRIAKRSLSTTATADCSRTNSHYCCKHERRIKLGQHVRGIVAPKEYRAFTCSGVCPVQHRSVSQWTSISQKVNPVRLPCCVPTGFQDMNILHYKDSNVPGTTKKVRQLIKTKISDMVVSSCGCL